MELLHSVIFLRGVQLVLIIFAGIICVIIGYKLFLYGIDKGRSKLRSKSEIYKLLFSGSGPGLFFMVLGGLTVIFSIYSVGISSEIAHLKNDLKENSDQMVAEIEQPDTLSLTKVFSKASFFDRISKPTPSRQSPTVTPKQERQIKGGLNLSEIDKRGSKSIYRNEEELARIINKHNRGIEYCYKLEVKKNPSLKGDLDVEFIIEPTGRVKAVRIVSSTMYSKKIEKCISNRIRGWRFEAIEQHEGDVKVRQKYIFG